MRVGRALAAVVGMLVLAFVVPASASAQGGDISEELAQPRPIAALNSVWIEELTWMEVRDAIADGATTVIVSTGGIEQNGPYLATGKHNVVLQGACEGIARTLGNALCAPVIKLVPEGDIDSPTGHMRYPGTIGLRQTTFRAVLDDVASSLRNHGFTDVIFIGDSGGNQAGMREVAAMLNTRWSDARAHYIPEFYEYAKAFEFMENELGVRETEREGIHDDIVITSIMTTVDPVSVRHPQRVEAGKASINGVDISDLKATQEMGEKILEFRVNHAVQAIRVSLGG